MYAGITSTTTVTKTLTFTSNQALQGISLEAVPAIAKFVQIQPSTVSKLPAGQPQTVRLTFSVPAGAQFGAYDGTIHVRAGSRTLPQTLKVSITYAVAPLPPDPGEAGKATTAGIDSDGDGVRDDIQRYIAFTYPTSVITRTALTQNAKAIESFVSASGTDQNSVYTLALREQAAAYCLFSSLGLENGRPAVELLRAQILNTHLRSAAYIAADRKLSGKSFDSPGSNWSSLCQ